MKSTSPVTSATSRAALKVSGRSVTLVQSGLAPQYRSFRATTSGSPGRHETKRYGPVPIAAAPVLKSSVLRPSAARLDWIAIDPRLNGTYASVSRVWTLTVNGSAISILVIAWVNNANDPGLLGTLPDRSSENATSSAV